MRTHTPHGTSFWLFHNSLFSVVLRISAILGWITAVPNPRFVVLCGTRSASAKEMHTRLSEATTVLDKFGFPQNRALAHNFLVYSPPPRRHMYFAMCRSWSPHDTCTNAMCRAGISSDTWQNTCASLGGGYTQKIVRAHDLGKPKTIDIFGIASLRRCSCSCSFTFVPHTSIRGNKEFSGQKPPCEKTNFRS